MNTLEAEESPWVIASFVEASLSKTTEPKKIDIIIEKMIKNINIVSILVFLPLPLRKISRINKGKIMAITEPLEPPKKKGIELNAIISSKIIICFLEIFFFVTSDIIDIKTPSAEQYDNDNEDIAS